jgi:hypothetical protein
VILEKFMSKYRKEALRLLRNLEKVFPEDMTAPEFDYLGAFDSKGTLKDNQLIEYIEHSRQGFTNKVSVPKITAKGIEFLNGLRQKRTNELLLALTILLFITGIIQIVILLVK